MTNLKMKIFSVLYWSAFTTICFLIFPFVLIAFLLTFAFDRRGVVVHMMCCAWGLFLFWINPFWHLQVRGREKIEWQKPYILVANHLSLFDIVVLYALFRPFKWLAKDSLLKIPIVGWTMRMNRYVPVKRHDPDSRHKAFELCHLWLKRGVSILFFPEGTRSQTGQLQAFHSGAFRLAIEGKVPMVPILIKGTRDILPKNSFVFGGISHVIVEVLDPIPAHSYTMEQLDEFKEKVRNQFSSRLGEE